jgi:hypothetical protein
MFAGLQLGCMVSILHGSEYVSDRRENSTQVQSYTSSIDKIVLVRRDDGRVFRSRINTSSFSIGQDNDEQEL